MTAIDCNNQIKNRTIASTMLTINADIAYILKMQTIARKFKPEAIS